MSGDEMLIFFVCSWVGVTAVHQLLVTALVVSAWGVSRAPRRDCILSAAVAMILLFLVLTRWSSCDVKSSFVYTGFYLVMGLAWIRLVLIAWAWMGLSYRDDVVERGNRSAASALGGVLIGGEMAFAGANIGDGPGWWVVVFCAGLSTGTLIVGWLILQAMARLADRITIDRDSASGWHAGGLFIACGMILGRAVAGNWVSAGATFVDFVRLGSPSLLLFVFAGFVERTARIAIRPGEIAFVRAWALPLLYLAVAVLLVRGAGPW